MSEKELIQPTKDEAKNGWTAETLTAYIQSVRKSEAEIFEGQWKRFKAPPRPMVQNHKYNPLRGWSGRR